MIKSKQKIRRLYKIAEVIFDKRKERVAAVKFVTDVFKTTWEQVAYWRNKQ